MKQTVNKIYTNKLRGPICKVIVEKDNVFYVCLATKTGYKCGKCLFGLINPCGDATNEDLYCRRCRAKLSETVSGYGYNLFSYRP